MKPDIVVIFTHQTVLFEPQNQRVAEWLRRRCNLVMENAGLYHNLWVILCQFRVFASLF
jgi:hypothetical protein